MSEIIHIAQAGQINSNVLSSKELLEQLREIKINLPKGTDLPLGLSTPEAYELIKISDITIYAEDRVIVFIINIATVEQHELILYHYLYIVKIINMFI